MWLSFLVDPLKTWLYGIQYRQLTELPIDDLISSTPGIIQAYCLLSIARSDIVDSQTDRRPLSRGRSRLVQRVTSRESTVQLTTKVDNISRSGYLVTSAPGCLSVAVLPISAIQRTDYSTTGRQLQSCSRRCSPRFIPVPVTLPRLHSWFV